MVINLIPWNPVYQPDGPFFAAPVDGAVEAFQGILRSTYGLHCTIRQEKGQDIAGAPSCCENRQHLACKASKQRHPTPARNAEHACKVVSTHCCGIWKAWTDKQSKC
jgi:hypothetical protein